MADFLNIKGEGRLFSTVNRGIVTHAHILRCFPNPNIVSFTKFESRTRKSEDKGQ